MNFARRLIVLSLGILLLGCQARANNVFWSEQESAEDLVKLPSFQPIAENIAPAVVNISTETQVNSEQQIPEGHPFDHFGGPEEFLERFFGQPFDQPQPQPRRAMGSGFFISTDGYILTNNHVIENATDVKVTIHESGKSQNRDQNSYEAEVVGQDPNTDIALLKIEAKEDLAVIPLGNSDQLQKGDWVVAIGNPFGLDNSISAGIVSAKGREISPGQSRRFDDFIQTDAAINLGNSGGPLVNLAGEVVGINTAIAAQGSGIGFAVPVNLVKDILPALRTEGSVARGYLGVQIQEVTPEIKEALGLERAEGALVNDIPPGPAAKSALREGDVIVSVDDKAIRDVRDLQNAIAARKPGKSVNLKVIREQDKIELSVTLGKLGEDQLSQRPQGPSEPKKADKLGLVVSPAEDGDGIEIQQIETDSPVASEVEVGDKLRSISFKKADNKTKNYPINSIEDYQSAIQRLEAGNSVMLGIERDGTRFFIGFSIPSN